MLDLVAAQVTIAEIARRKTSCHRCERKVPVPSGPPDAGRLWTLGRRAV